MTLKDRIKQHEGFRSAIYQDTVGKWTIGYGRNLSDKGITESEADFLLTNDISAAMRQAEKLPFYANLTQVRKEVITEMIFNIGLGGLLKFTKFITAIHLEDWEEAADEMLNSKWARQVGNRAKELAALFRNTASS